MTIITSPLTRQSRLLVAALITALAFALASTGVGQAQDRPDPTQTAPTTTTEADGYVATAAFNTQWKKARADFKNCKLNRAWNRYKPLRTRGFDLADPVKRTKFYRGVVTTAWESGRRTTARRYANRWRKWGQAYYEEHGNVGGFVSGQDAFTIMSILPRERYPEHCK